MLKLFTLKPLEYDTSGKAKSLRIFSFEAPHMRCFHLSWIAFFCAFMGWFAYAPILKHTVGPNLNMSDIDVSHSDTANVAVTVFFRMAAGPMFGPTRVIAAILILGSVPLGLSTLSQGAPGIIASRVFIGLLGATFVPCQSWTTAMFSSEIVATANAVAGGWGNMGGGFTNLIMPRVYSLFHYTLGLSISTAWRTSIGIMVILLVAVAIFVYCFGVDKPPVTLIQQIPELKAEPAAIPSFQLTTAQKLIIAMNTVMLMFHYACTFGVELAFDGALASFYITEFQLDQSNASLFAGLSGMMNLCSRATGGILSDLLHAKFGMKDRLILQLVLFLISAGAIMGFSVTHNLAGSIALLVLFSFSVQAGSGSTFGIAPFVSPYMGTLTGCIGAGGNIGGALFNILLTHHAGHLRTAFFIIGAIVAGIGVVSTMFLSVDGESVLAIFCFCTNRSPSSDADTAFDMEEPARDVVEAASFMVAVQ